MSAFDRLEGYSARHTSKDASFSASTTVDSSSTKEKRPVFDIKTPKGAFLDRIHNEGYKMYNYVYNLPLEISQEVYDSLSDDIKRYYCLIIVKKQEPEYMCTVSQMYLESGVDQTIIVPLPHSAIILLMTFQLRSMIHL